MKTAVKVIAIIVAAVVVLFGALAAYLAFIFDPNDYRGRIAAEVEKATGRSLAINGDIGLSVFPWIGVEIEQVSLGNAPGFGDQPFASAGLVEVRARLLPLLRSELEVARVVLRDLDAGLVIDAQGNSNWADLVGDAGDEPSARDGGAALAGMVIAGVQIDSARVSYSDRQSNTQYVVENLDLKTGEVRAGSRFPLELGFDVTSNAPEMSGRVDITGDVLFDLAGPSADIEEFRFTFKGEGAGLPGGQADLSLTSKLAVDMAAGTASINGMEVNGYGVKVLGTFAAKGLKDKLAVSGTFEVPTLDPLAVMKAMDIEAPEVSDSAVLKRASMKARVEATASSVALRDFVAVLDDSNLAGEVALTDLARKALRFDLQLDGINLDRYLPPSDKTAKPAPSGKPSSSQKPAGGAKPATEAEALIDPAMLLGLDVTGKMRVGTLVVAGATLSDISLDVRAQNGVVRLSPLSATLYEGRYAGNIVLDGRGQALAVSLDETLKGVQVAPLLRDLTGAEERLTGNANLTAKLQMRGNDVEAMKRTLGGNVDFSFLNGAVKGVNIAHFVRQAQARISGQPAPPLNEPNQTDFSQLTGTLQIANGVARNDDLDVRSPLLRVGGSGSVNIPAETIDYGVRASVVATLTGQGGQGLENLKGVTVPIKVSGTFSNPSYGLDVQALMSGALKQQTQQAQERLKGELQERVTPDVQEKLRGLGGLLNR